MNKDTEIFDFDFNGILEFPCGITRGKNGNTLIADAGSISGQGSEILEVNPEGELVWQWQGGLKFVHGIKELPNGNILLADTSNNRILEVDRKGKVVFSSDDWSGGTGQLSDGSHLHYPNNVHVVDRESLMITDRNNDRFVVINHNGDVLWSFSEKLKHPHNCEPLANGNVIIADSDNNAVAEINYDGHVVWFYNDGLDWPRDANRLPNGNTLITDSKNSRVIEVMPTKEIVWECKVDYFANFYEAHRLENGNTLISDQQHQQVLEVGPLGDIVWKFRNFKREYPIHDRLTNGFFKHVDAQGRPLGWILATRLSEGGGNFLWGQNNRGKRVPGLEFDRSGALCFQQTVKAEPGQRYTMGGSVMTQDLEGYACFQVAFIDQEGGLLCDAAKAPRGEVFTGEMSWTQDSFEVVAPQHADAADIRIFMTGKGKIFFDQLRFYM